MSFWLINVPQNLKVISESPDFKIFYMKAGTPEFIEISMTPTFAGDSLYLISHVFTDLGKYLIKLKHNNSDQVHYNELEVINREEYMKLNTNYSVQYAGAYLVFDNE